MVKNFFLYFFLFITLNTDLLAQTSVTGETELYLQLKNVDRKLNVTYKQVIKKMSKAARVLIKIQQREWIKERDARCKGNEEGGVVDNKIYIDCLIRETEKRIKQLDSLNTPKV